VARPVADAGDGVSGHLPPPLPADRSLPRVDRLDVDHPRYVEIVQAHEAASEEGRPTYRDPITGYRVFTAATLWARGACCESGCRHCPYGDVQRAQPLDGTW
jgi:hypothetical protein